MKWKGNLRLLGSVCGNGFETFVLFDSSLLTQSRTKRAQAAQELRDREEVEKELSVVKAWIQETREFLLNPTPDIDSQLQELEVRLLSKRVTASFPSDVLRNININVFFAQVVHGDVITYRQNVDKLAEQQQSKYLDLYTILPSEISMQLAEVSLALGAIEDQVSFIF